MKHKHFEMVQQENGEWLYYCDRCDSQITISNEMANWQTEYGGTACTFKEAYDLSRGNDYSDFWCAQCIEETKDDPAERLFASGKFFIEEKKQDRIQ